MLNEQAMNRFMTIFFYRKPRKRFSFPNQFVDFFRKNSKKPVYTSTKNTLAEFLIVISNNLSVMQKMSTVYTTTNIQVCWFIVFLFKNCLRDFFDESLWFIADDIFYKTIRKINNLILKRSQIASSGCQSSK